MIIALAGLALLVLVGKRGMRGNPSDTPEDSTGEDSYTVSKYAEDTTYDDEPFADILGSYIGAPYYYGKGSPSTPLDEIWNGADCSGAVQMGLVAIGYLDAGAPDRSVVGLANDCVPIEVGEQRPGDLAIYDGHVMLVYSYPRSDGHSAVWGMHGGGKSDLGNNPNARLDVMSTALYWKDAFLTYARFKESV